MPRTAHHKRTKESIEAQFALAERVLRNLNQSIDDQIERQRDLEVGHALALYKAGRVDLVDGDEMIRRAKERLK